MSRHNKHRRPEREKPGCSQGNAFVSTFGDRVGVEMRSTKELMNWLIFGDVKQNYYQPNQRNHEGF